MKAVRKSTVRSSDADASANLSVIGMFQIAQDCVTDILGKYKIDGVTIRKKYNAFWVFAKNSVRLIKPIAWGDEYTAEGFVTSFSLARVVVDTAVKNAAGELAAYSRIELCALDAATGRICKTSAIGVDEHVVCEPAEAELSSMNIDVAGLPTVERATVRSTNIDFSHHTNNVEYLRFLFNTYSADELLSRPVKAIEVHYVNQSYEGDLLEVCKLSDGDSDVLSIVKDGKLILKSRIGF